MNNMQAAIVAFTFLLNLVNTAETVLTDTLASLIKSDKVKLSTHTLTVRKNISDSGGTYDVIDANTKKEKGISTLDGNKLNNEVILFNRVAVGYSVGTQASGAGAQAYGSSLPNQLRNAFLVIKQGGRTILHEPIANFTAQGTAQSPREYYMNLIGWEYISDVDTFDIQIEYPVGASLDAADANNNHYFEVRLSGAKTVTRNA